MNAYDLLLFTHVLGTVALFATMAVEAVALRLLRRTDSTAGAGAAASLLALPLRLNPLAMAAILLSGLAMMAMAWRHQAWTVAAFLGLAAMGALGGLISTRRFRRIRAALAAEDASELSDALRSVGALSAALRLRTAIGVAVLALMSFKPEIGGATLTLAIGAVVGLLVARVPLARGGSTGAVASASAGER